jgi:hypothetical protein
MGLDQRVQALELELERLRVISVPRAVVARCETAAGQSIPNGAATIIDYGTVSFDPDSHVTTGASWRFTAKLAGYYRITAAACFNGSTTWALGEVGDLRLFKNGAEVSKLDRDDEMNSGVTSQFKFLAGSDLVVLAVDDYIDVRLFQNSGGALPLFTNATFNYVAINRIS